MLRTVLLTGAIWFGVALVVGLLMGRYLRLRSQPPRAKQREQDRNIA
jgi:hypothetical protein